MRTTHRFIGVLVLAAVGLQPGVAASSSAAEATCDGQVVTLVAAPSIHTVGTSGPDVILGTEDDDKIDGSGGDDVICGLGGLDMIRGGDGDDRIFGGDDAIRKSDFGWEYSVGDEVNPGAGDDYVDLGFDPRPSPEARGGDWLDLRAAAGPVHLDLSDPDGVAVMTGWGTDTVLFIPGMSVTGGPHDDILIGSPLGDSLAGSGGDDVIEGGPGDDYLAGEEGTCCMAPVDEDVLRGGDGNDRLTATAGHDVMAGGGGDDVFQTRAAAGATMNGGAGDDAIHVDVDTSQTTLARGGPGRDFLGATNDLAEELRGRMVVDVVSHRITSPVALVNVRFAGFETYELSDSGRFFYKRHWAFKGSALDEELLVRGETVRARMRGGDDRVIVETSRGGVVWGGKGRDTVEAYSTGGLTWCRGVEIRQACYTVT